MPMPRCRCRDFQMALNNISKKIKKQIKSTEIEKRIQSLQLSYTRKAGEP